MNPPGYLYSYIAGISNGHQAGYGVTASGNHALLWNGIAESVIDLHPKGFGSSIATAILGAKQVGQATPASANPGTGFTTAFVWESSSESAIDLSQFLPARSYNSKATGIDSCGNISGSASVLVLGTSAPTRQQLHILLENRSHRNYCGFQSKIIGF